MTSPADASFAEVMLGFQSLGDNCEFGLVQRCCGVEPLGLFRFVNAALPQLVRAFDEDFAPFGADGDLSIFAGYADHLWCRSLRYDFTYTTNELVGTIDPDRLLKREYGKIAYLKRRMREELAEGSKIFVRKGRPTETLDEFLELARAIRRHGPSIVLRVETAPTPASIGTAHWHADGVLRGYVRRFSPYEGGMDIDLEPWVDLCREAWRLASPPGGVPPAARDAGSVRLASAAASHVTGRKRHRRTRFSSGADARLLEPDAINVFSAWVWLPSRFDADQVFAFLHHSGTYHRLAHRGADPTCRDSWQRVWVSAEIPAGAPKTELGLMALGPSGQRFWSTDWRVGHGPVPPDCPPPRMTIGGGLKDRLLGVWARWTG